MERFDNKNYVVDKIVGKGPQGNVYKAQRVSDGALCAIKELDVRHLTEEGKEDLTEEIRVLATVQNENVISYYDAFLDEDRLYAVMEYCDEGDLGKHIKAHAEQQKFFSEAQVWSYFIQMLRGLVALHSKGLIHRNVRPGNVIQLDSNAVKLGDVGVGKLKEGLAATQIGDPHYVPPEVWENKAYTFKGDVWAVGCVLYEMIALAVPFGGCSLPDLRLKVIEGLYQPIPSSYSSGLSKVLKLLLNPNQAARIAARDMLVHPILQEHLQNAPAPSLRVRTAEVNAKLRAIPVNGSDTRQPKGSYPTLVVPADKQSLQKPAFLAKRGVIVSPANRHQSGLPNEKPAAILGVSKVTPILAPRAILSSPDNDKMLSELNRTPNQGSKVKVPRVAMLGKVIPKSPSETSAAPAIQSHSSTPLPRINLKHFKKAYIQPPKVVTDEFPAVDAPINHEWSNIARKEKLENPVTAPGMSKKKPVPTLMREKSAESVRSVPSSHSDDSLIRVRAPIDDLHLSHSKASTPRREGSVESASSQPEDSVIRARVPMDISAIPHPSVSAHTGDSVRSAAIDCSLGSGKSASVTISELGSAQHMRNTTYPSIVNPAFVGRNLGVKYNKSDNHALTRSISNKSSVSVDVKGLIPGRDGSPDLLKSFGGDGTHQSQDPIDHVRIDGPESPQRRNESTRNEPLASDRLKVRELGSSACTPRAPVTKPVLSQNKAATPRGHNSFKAIAGDAVAHNHSVNSVTGMSAPGEMSDRIGRLPNSNGVISDEGIRKEKLEMYSDVSGLSKTNSTTSPAKVAAPRGENSGVLMRSGTGDVAATEHLYNCITQVGEVDDGSAQSLQKPAGNLGLAVEGVRKLKPRVESPAVTVTRQPTDGAKNSLPKRVNSLDSHGVVASEGKRINTTGYSASPKSALPDGTAQITSKASRHQLSTFNGMRQEKSQKQGATPGMLKTKPSPTPRKVVIPQDNTSADWLKSEPTAATLRKYSAYTGTISASNQESKEQADDTGICVRTRAAGLAQSPQKPMRSRRLSLDFPIKSNEIQPVARSFGRTSGAKNGAS